MNKNRDIGLYNVFLDTEWTCWKSKKDNSLGRRELLSVGLVITDGSLQEIDSFYEVVKPFREPRLSKFCRELTGISQHEVNEASLAEDVIGRLMGKLNEYGEFENIYVWGDTDRLCFKLLSKRTRIDNFSKLADKFIDLESIVTKGIKCDFGFENKVSLVNMLHIYNVESRQAHNALNDARMLVDVYREYCNDNTFDYCFLKGFVDKQIKLEWAYNNRVSRKCV